MTHSSLRESVLLAVRLLAPRWSRLALATTFGVLSLGSALTLAAVAAWLITRAWQMPPVLDLSIAAVAVRALGISRAVFGYCERLASHDTALRAAATARTRLYRTLVDAPADVVLRLDRGDLSSRLGASVDDLSEVLVRAVLPIAVAAVLSTAAVGVLAVYSIPAAACLACCVLIAGVVAPGFAARAAGATERLAGDRHAARDAAVMMALDHGAELRVAGRLDDVLAEASRRQRDWGRAADRAARPAAFATAAPTAAVGVSVLGALVAAMALAPTTPPTSLAILLLLPLSAFEATTALPGAAVALIRARIALRRIHRLVEPAPAQRIRPATRPLDVRPGQRLALVGPSGSGKTTLLMATAAACGENGSAAAYFAEDAHVFDTTLRDNLLVARGDATDSDIVSALRRVGLGAWLDELPEGLSTVLVGGADALSAGQRRRLLLARAVLCTFPVVLLDEPTEHLDAVSGRQLLVDLLRHDGLFAADRTVVVATHHLPDHVDCPVVALAPDQYPRPT